MVFDQDVFRRLCRARDYLAGTPGPASLHEAAREAGMSPFHFIRRFEAVFGATPHQYRIGLRIDRARQLLAAGQWTVTEVCLEVGMSSLGSFSELFLRRVGETPSAYRRRARTLVSVPGALPLPLFPGCLSLLAHLPPGVDLRRNSAIFEKREAAAKKYNLE
jgi:AraC-like DNA-binding protein